MENLKLRDLFDKFITYGVVIRNYRPLTVVQYEVTFKLFLQDMKIEYLEELNTHIIKEWFFYGRTNRK